ncbi:hypothetical protein E4U42_001713 [Claviceps africana]|uniref:Uncharacterized protein n=1 Tax=Claviceps africana TaxID=83212 RepID=A0A8K0JAC9_9HYPO|nr:hypothetical protein E4U42_001713 [Claviceps africana]
MAPETRSRGVPPPSRVYHASPTLQQVQFPSRRKKVRRHTDSERRSLKQQTLTQIDFVSSFDGEDGDVVALSEDDIDAGQNGPLSSQEEDDELPIPRKRRRVGALAQEASKRRRRTMGDEGVGKEEDGRMDGGCRRRKTLGDGPPPASYHTQTLTQFLGHQTSFVADSEEEEEEEEEELCGFGADGDERDDGFLSWLEGAGPGSPSAGRGRPGLPCPTVGTSPKSATVGEDMSRETSVIPQTPLKKQSTAVRFDIRSQGLPSPSERMLDRYEAPDVQDSPLKNRSSPMDPPRRRETNDGGVASSPAREQRPSSVIRDSYTTEEEGCNTPSKSNSQSHDVRSTPKGKGTCRPTHILCTPSKERTSQKDGALAGTGTPKQSKTRSLREMTRAGLYEIPDSDEDEDDHGMDYVEDAEDRMGIFDAKYGAGVETQAVMSEIASSHEQRDDEAAHEHEPSLPLPLPLPRSQRATRQHQQVLARTQAQATSRSTTTAQDDDKDDDDNDDERRSSTAMAPTPTSIPTPVTSEPIRRPLHHPSSYAQPSQPWESQRVPVSELQSLPAPSARSDILLPISSGSLHPLLTGHTLAVTTPFRIPAQVVRFWLLENHVLRYMTTVEPGEQQQRRQASPPRQACPPRPGFRFHATQVYELNNPVSQQDMLEEGWVDASLGRYSYLPPAVVGQLLWNLRHALFGAAPEDAASAPTSRARARVHQGTPKHGPGRTEPTSRRAASPPPGSMTVSQQVTAQIHSDMACSAPDDTTPSTPRGRPKQRQHQQPEGHDRAPAPEPELPTDPPHPAIRPSQATTLSQASTPAKSPSQHHISPLPASDPSIRFLDHSNPLSSLPLPSSQSTPAQLLPDTLLRDHPPPTEIWDSDEHPSP